MSNKKEVSKGSQSLLFLLTKIDQKRRCNIVSLKGLFPTLLLTFWLLKCDLSATRVSNRGTLFHEKKMKQLTKK
jgi:hypothetical protein